MFIKNWFSNMELLDKPLVHEDISYTSVENFYQAQKLYVKENKKWIASLPPRKAKVEIGKIPWRADWNISEKLKIMEFALRYKFRSDTSWGKLLLETNDEEIVEWNNWNDVFWGKDVITKEGKNHLGKLLMHIRQDLHLTQLLG